MASTLLTANGMMHYDKLVQNNAEWAKAMLERDPEFFAKREAGQAPHSLIIGCSDSRVPLEVMTGALPGEVFVHRNIGNQASGNDLSAQSVVQFAVDVLEIRHIIVCGHSNCGALKAAGGEAPAGMLDHWLSEIRDTIRTNQRHLDGRADAAERLQLLARLNVTRQVRNLASSPTVRNAWKKGKRPSLHGWIFNLGTGLIERAVERVDSHEAVAHLEV